MSLESLLNQFDVNIYLTCDVYSSRSQLAEFPSFTRYHIGALYCWLLWLPDNRWSRLKEECSTIGFHKAMILSFNQASQKESKLTLELREFLPRLASIHIRAAIDLVQAARDENFRIEASRFVYDMFDKTQSTYAERAMWSTLLAALEGLMSD